MFTVQFVSVTSQMWQVLRSVKANWPSLEYSVSGGLILSVVVVQVKEVKTIVLVLKDWRE